MPSPCIAVEIVLSAAQADADRLGKWLKGTYGLKASSSPAIVIAEPARQHYYSLDSTGSPLSLSSAPALFKTLETHTAGTLKGGQHSVGKMERAAQAIGQRTEWIVLIIGAHPLWSIVVFVVGTLGCFVLLLRFVDAPSTVSGQMGSGPYEKKD